MILTRRRALGRALGTTAAIAATGLAPGRARAQGGQGGPVPVAIAISSDSLAYGGLKIAQRAGLFEQNGIAAKVTTMESGNAALTAVLSGSVQFSSSGPGEVLAARVRGQKVVIVANIYRGLSGSLVLAKGVAGRLGPSAAASVEAKLKALAGLVVATPSATSAYTHPYKSAAEAVGVQPRFAYMAQPAMLAALQAGAVQGIICGAPFSITAVANGSGVMWISGPKAELPERYLPSSSACLQTSETYAAAHPEVVAKLQATFAALASTIKDQPAEARRVLARAYPQLDAPTIAAIFRDDSPNWTHPIMTADDIRKEIAIQQSSGSLKGVEAIQPSSVLMMPK
jgi:ABC-type nitrate/sulfonate/bicarbonate transport system substrate-binding protein